MQHARHLVVGLTALLAGWAASLAAADQPSAEDDAPRFLRVLRDDQEQALALQTSIVRYAGAADGPSVDLIGAIHIADRAYFEGLNRRFKSYDAVLYELVAPEENKIPEPDAGTRNPVSALQVGFKSLLDLEYQLDFIDYRRPNLVHADLSPEEFARSMADRGESILQMFFRALGQSAAIQSQDPAPSRDLDLFAALLSRNRAQLLKRIVAEQFDDTQALAVFDGPEGSTIITVRNTRALDVLAEQIGRGKKRLAIFYGAAHLPDMERQLKARFALESVGEEWLTAWDLKSRPERAPEAGKRGEPAR